MKKLVFVLFLLLCGSVYAESDGFWGIRIMQDLGLEGGKIWRNYGFKVYTSIDYNYNAIYILGLTDEESTRDDDDPARYDGRRYHLTYGAGLMMHIYRPIWLSLDAGYAWSGNHAYDPSLSTSRKYGSVNNKKGLELGGSLMWNFENFYISAGYAVMPLVIKDNKSSGLFSISIGFINFF